MHRRLYYDDLPLVVFPVAARNTGRAVALELAAFGDTYRYVSPFTPMRREGSRTNRRLNAFGPNACRSGPAREFETAKNGR
jgi:hypothetical protein